MFKLIKRLSCVGAVFLMVFPLVSCSGGGSSSTAGGTTGTLGISLTDATTDQYQAIYVTIDEIQVKQGFDDEEVGWLTVLTPGQTFNLLELVNGVIADLGLAELEAGDYGQMRLILGELPETPGTNILGGDHPYANYLIKTADDSIEELKVPSGYQTGIKIVHGFTIVASGATELILDFDALKSVVQAGNSGQWLLKPTIKVLETVNNSVSGVVDEGVDAPLEGALVSAQVYTPPPEPEPAEWDPKGEVSIAGGTVSGVIDDINGAYLMYLPPNTYNIVVTMENFAPGCQVVAATGYLDYTADFTLIPAETGTFTGSVTGLATADSALFSIRQENADCSAMIEVASVSVANDATFDPIILPVGTYEVVVSGEGETTQVFDVVVEVSPAEAVLDVDFTP